MLCAEAKILARKPKQKKKETLTTNLAFSLKENFWLS